MRRKTPPLISIVFVLALAAGCQKGPRPIALDTDQCAFCRMTVSDPRFAAELVTGKGKVHPFDSVECLAAYAETAGDGADGTPWVTDFNQPGAWIKAEEAFYVRAPALRSPMGLNVAAFKTRAQFEKAKGEYRGAEMRWAEVRTLVLSTGFAGRAQKQPHGESQP